MTPPNKVAQLKDALLTELINQFENGVTARDREGEVVKLSVDSRVMTVASKVIKDWAGEIPNDREVEAKAQKLETFLQKRRDLRTPPPVAN